MTKTVFTLFLLLFAFSETFSQDSSHQIFASIKAVKTKKQQAAFTLNSLPTEKDVRIIFKPEFADSLLLVFQAQKKWLSSYYARKIFATDSAHSDFFDGVRVIDIDSCIKNEVFRLDKPMDRLIRKFKAGGKLIKILTVNKEGMHSSSYYWIIVDRRLIFIWDPSQERWYSSG